MGNKLSLFHSETTSEEHKLNQELEAISQLLQQGLQLELKKGVSDECSYFCGFEL
jgi:hypothetical protein